MKLKTKAVRHQLTVLHVGTLNKPIGANLGYSPIETVIYNIDKGLVSRGVRSIVACSSDSHVVGEKHTTVDRGFGDYCQADIRGGAKRKDHHLRKTLERCMKGDVDIVHMHEWMEHVYDGTFNPPLPIVMTLHVEAQNSGLDCILKSRDPRQGHPPVYYTAISEYQKRDYSKLAHIYRVVHHGVDIKPTPLSPSSKEKEYLFSIGRITAVKGQDKAIQIARKTGSKLIIAGCVQKKPEDLAYFESLKKSIDLCVDVSRFDGEKNYYQNVLKPLLNSGKQVIYVGELNGAQKKVWYEHALGTLLPIQWGEPFGLVAIESMANGTPVLGMNRGALPEIVEHGRTGFIVNSVQEMMGRVKHLAMMDREVCHRHVHQHFSIDRMAQNYSIMYQHVIEEQQYKTPGLMCVQV
jgi:glycosyltransferase involved in cell wall biosynthesis